jgi:septal ring-binding cell division protein DamX
VYADRDAAVQARSQLPASLDGAGIWPRTFGSIQEQLGE